jgi:hypothetical protein
MSTVQSLLDDLQFRVDVDADLYHIINRAIRLLAKRLYWHKSDILREEMELDLYAEVEYAAGTIAFVNNAGSADTITDTANQFVAEGFVAGMIITTDNALNPGPFTIATVAVGTLTLATTDSLTGVTAGTTITITSKADRVNLPSDFWGFCSDGAEDYPHIDGYFETLKPLPSRLVSLQLSSAATPRYFKVKGQRLYLYPPTTADITIKGDYFKRPTAVSAVTDTLPYFEFFDDALGEIVAMFYNKDLSSQAENQALLERIYATAVDAVIPEYSQKAPAEVSGGIEWDSFS